MSPGDKAPFEKKAEAAKVSFFLSSSHVLTARMNQLARVLLRYLLLPRNQLLSSAGILPEAEGHECRGACGCDESMRRQTLYCILINRCKKRSFGNYIYVPDVPVFSS